VTRGARTVRITAHKRKLRIEGSADPKLTQTVAHMFRLDEDLSGFYELVREDELAWCRSGQDACFELQQSLRMSSRRRVRSYESSTGYG